MVLDNLKNSPVVIEHFYDVFQFFVPFWIDFHCTIKSSLDIMLNISLKDVSTKQIQNQICTSLVNVRFMLYLATFFPLAPLTQMADVQRESELKRKEKYNYIKFSIFLELPDKGTAGPFAD